MGTNKNSNNNNNNNNNHHTHHNHSPNHNHNHNHNPHAIIPHTFSWLEVRPIPMVSEVSCPHSKMTDDFNMIIAR